MTTWRVYQTIPVKTACVVVLAHAPIPICQAYPTHGVLVYRLATYLIRSKLPLVDHHKTQNERFLWERPSYPHQIEKDEFVQRENILFILFICRPAETALPLH